MQAFHCFATFVLLLIALKVEKHFLSLTEAALIFASVASWFVFASHTT